MSLKNGTEQDFLKSSRPASGVGRRHKAGGLRKTPLFLLLLFLALFLAGVLLDEPVRVLEQARSICLECIGIG